MTWRLLRSVLMDEVNGEGGDLGGGGNADAGAAGDAAAGAQGDQVIDANAGGKVEEPKGATTDGMLGAIKEGLAKGGIGGDAAIQTDAEKAAAAAGKPAAAAPAGQAAGDPKAGAKPQTDEAKAAAEKLAGETLAKKKPDEFKLTDQEKAVLGPKAQARFQELTHYGKVQYDRAERVQQENSDARHRARQHPQNLCRREGRSAGLGGAARLQLPHEIGRLRRRAQNHREHARRDPESAGP
jgi:hypothetical protein